MLKKEKWLLVTYRCYKLEWIRSKSTISVSKSPAKVKWWFMAASFNFSMWILGLTYKSQRSKLINGKIVSNLNSPWTPLLLVWFSIYCPVTNTDRREIVLFMEIISSSSIQISMAIFTIQMKSPCPLKKTQLYPLPIVLTAPIEESKVYLLYLIKFSVGHFRALWS